MKHRVPDNTPTAHIHFANGRAEPFRDPRLAYAVWLCLPKGISAAFRGRNDTRPVYTWDFVDAL